LKNNDDYDTDNKELMHMQDDYDFCMPTINSNNQSDTFVGNSPYQNTDD